MTLDPAQTDIFLSGGKTVSLLRRMAARHGVPAETIDLGACKVEKPHDLAVLEREGLLPCTESAPSDGQSVRIFYAASPFEECEHAAAYIRRNRLYQGAEVSIN